MDKQSGQLNFCTACGHKFEAASAFCPACGASMVSTLHAKSRTQASTPGKNFLKVSGILLIIFGAISAISSLATLMTIDTWLFMFGGQAMRDTWELYYTLAALFGGFSVFVGIICIVNCKNLQKAKFMRTLGIIYIAVTILFIVMNFANGVYGHLGMGGTTGILLLLELVLPVLIIIGANKNVGMGR